MGAGHAHTLHYHGHSRIHRLAPEVKVAATFGFVLMVALTPQRVVWAYVAHTVLLVSVIAVARLPLRFVAARLAVVVPFVVFALFLPLVAGGPTVDVVGVALSRSGLWSMFAIAVKASLGAAASITLTGTTEPFDILAGLRRLRVPAALVTIAAFMLRYLELLADEFARMRTAMVVRGHQPRWLSDARPLAGAAGVLFVRSYERGERIHAAMLGRGFTGSMPETRRSVRRSSDLMGAAVFVTAAFIVMVVSRVGAR